MTTADSAPPLVPPAPAAAPLPPSEAGKIPMQVVPHSTWDRFEALLDRAGEFLNPILVKEARQALKSRQFVITFTLVLVCGWGWSLLGVALQGQDVFYAPSGPFMLMGYHWVLAFPLILIVPFAAFRSLAGEREDGTYELLSITTLWPRQIIGGKLGSAVLQIMVYLSALAPCIAFTYLLRGIDIISIMLFVAYTLTASLLLSMLGLLVATVSKAKHWQIVLSVIMILMLAGIYFWGSGMATAWFMEGEVMAIDRSEFWVAHLALLSAAGSIFALLYVASAARISFPSDNRSTRLRIVMLVQQALLTGWCMYYSLTYKEAAEYILPIYFTFTISYWMATGALMCGENPQLSQRVRRSLPQSLLGRTLLTWFNPGPGAGFMFAACNLLGALAVGTLVGLQIKSEISPTPYDPTQTGLWGFVLWMFHALDPREIGFGGRMRMFLAAFDWNDDWLQFGFLGVCYVFCFLGVGRIIVLLARRAARVGLFVSLLLQVVLILLGTLAPFVVQFSLLYETDYTILQITNPFWTLTETLTGDILSYDAKILFWRVPVVPVALSGTAGVLFIVNLALSSSEASRERQTAPERVLEDERALHPERFEQPARLSPWDEAPGTSPFAKT